MFGITHWSRFSTYGESRRLVCTYRNWKPSQSEILSKHVGPFIKISFLFRCFSQIFAKPNQLPGFSISKLANVEGFLNVNINMNINDYSFKCICVVCYLNLVFIASPILHCWIWINSAAFATPSSRQWF